MTQRSNKNREGLLLPILLPVGILALIALVLFGFSRVLLQLSKTTATSVALFTAAAVFGIVSVVASRRRVSGAAMFPMLGAILGAALLISGVGLLVGPKGEAAHEVEALEASIAAPSGAATEGFSTDTLDFETGVPTNLAFDNQDPSVPHNVVIFEGKDDTGTQVFAGALVTGPAATVYQVPGLAAGPFFFHCEVHPTTMVGEITVSDAPAEGGGGGTPGGGLSISAASLAFSTDSLTTAADTATTLAFDNQEPGVPHNVAIFKDEEFSDNVFTGELITGPAAKDYPIPPLAPGTYYFRCDVHPTMKGTLEATGGGAGPSDGATPSASG
jgi:plastocyanin